MRLVSFIMTMSFGSRASFVLLSIAVFASASAAEIVYEIDGIGDPLRSNVVSHVQAFSIQLQSNVSAKDYDEILADSIAKAKVALRPYGYYQSAVNGSVTEKASGDVVVSLTVSRGSPVLVDQVIIKLQGEGEIRSSLKTWRDSWPLTTGDVLDQTVWEERKQFVLNEARKIGYLEASFSEHRLDVDLETNRANLLLVLDTGRQFLFGDIKLGEHMLKPGIIEHIARFHTGDPYSLSLLNTFRGDLWKTGYFTEVVVKEIPRADLSPPQVDLEVVMQTDTRNTYQGSVGFGTDTGARLQALWGRHPMSSNGDRLDLGAGWQEQDDEYSVRGTYRLPRRNRVRQYWSGDLTLRHENTDLDVAQSANDNFIRIASGTVDERHLRVGRLKVRNFKSGDQQAFETLFVQALSASDELVADIPAPDLLRLLDDPEAGRLLKGSDKTLSIGFDYDRIAIMGKSWETEGHRERAWVFVSDESFGSDKNFLQAYASARRDYLRGDRWKFLLRAEVGYTNAKVSEFEISVDGNPLLLSLTSLPNFYRFNAGGSNSVRGYGFEELSDNRIGSNNIVTASAEVEMKFLDKWSAALFFDIGNAFNDWSNPELKAGIGVGLRWYSIAGPIRLDFAQAQDLIDKPWRVHFTIGTPLL
jgi:translocation and assembly module TamA